MADASARGPGAGELPQDALLVKQVLESMVGLTPENVCLRGRGSNL